MFESIAIKYLKDNWIQIVVWLLLAFVCASVYRFGEQQGSAMVQRLWDQQSLNDAHALMALRKQVDDTEHEHQTAIADIATKHQKEIEDEKFNSSHVIDGLNAGLIKLRNRFTQCSSAGSMPDTGASAGIGDGSKGLRLLISDAGFFIREASRANQVADQLRACQAVIQEDRRLCGAKP